MSIRTYPHPLFATPSASRPYKTYTLRNFRLLPHMQRLSEEQKFAIEVVGHVLPFKTNSYVVENLIQWEDVPDDPMFILTFPQKDMLAPTHFDKMAATLRNEASPAHIREVANEIRQELNPHPAGQLQYNIPSLGDQPLKGLQHKYHETVLFFPSQGQTCHAYCSFCFRWPQFVGIQVSSLRWEKFNPSSSMYSNIMKSQIFYSRAVIRSSCRRMSSRCISTLYSRPTSPLFKQSGLGRKP